MEGADAAGAGAVGDGPHGVPATPATLRALLDLTGPNQSDADVPVAFLLFLQRRGLLPAERRCPYTVCGRRMTFSSTDRSLEYRCSSKGHPRVRVSIRVGTIFSRGKLSLSTSVSIMYLWVSECSLTTTMRLLGVGEHAAVDWYNYCREVCVLWAKGLPKIGGPGKIVEVDESKIGSRKYNRGRRVNGVWVFGGVERQGTGSFAVRVPDRSAGTLLCILSEKVLPGTIIMSDCWKAYAGVQELGMTHLTVNHSRCFVDPHTGAHTNTVERFWREVKCHLPARARGCSEEHVDGYLCAAMWRRAHRETRDRFGKFLQTVRSVFPVDSPLPPRILETA